MRKIAIIGGTGVGDTKMLTGFKTITVQTPYGPTSLRMGKMEGNQVIFIARHGAGHSVPPHKVNYRANIWALKSLGTEEIFATTAVGSLNAKMTAGHFVVCDQVLDFTKNRINTFFNGDDKPVVHTDFTNPYCPCLREKVIDILKKLKYNYHKTGCYVCTDGPRFESAAEIKMYAKLGGDLVGMTNMPEAILAREAEMCYTNCSIVTNMGAGISKNPLSHNEVVTAMNESSKKMENIIMAFISYDKKTKGTCSCKEAIKEFGGFKL